MSREIIKRVCVYAASSNQISKEYIEETRILGKILAQNKIDIAYGGGHSGLMGAIADSALEHGGRVIGIIPKFMYDSQWGHKGAEMVVVGDMHERKKKMVDQCDAVIALPGGAGTFEELLEVITWKKLGIYTKPIIILNTKNYYEHLIKMLERAVAEGFMSKKHLMMWTVVDKATDVLDAILSAPEWSEENRNIVGSELINT